MEAKIGVQKEAYFREHGHIPNPQQFQGWLNKERGQDGTLQGDVFWNNPDALDPDSDWNRKVDRTLPKVVDNRNLFQNLYA